MRKGGGSLVCTGEVSFVRTGGVSLVCTGGVSYVHTGGVSPMCTERVSLVRTGGVSLVRTGEVSLVRTSKLSFLPDPHVSIWHNCCHPSPAEHTSVLVSFTITCLSVSGNMWLNTEMWLTIGKVGPTNSSNSRKLRGVHELACPS